MRILILGNNYTGKALGEHLKKDSKNIVFSNYDNYNLEINFSNFDDIIEFSKANEINLVIPTEQNYISDNLGNALNELNITYFAPMEEPYEICKYKSSARKFSYKSKIPTPKFFIAEKLQLALEYLKTANYPIAIHPDIKTYRECVKFAETFGQAQAYINDFFKNGNKKIVIENYIDGKNIIFWAISDGYKTKIIGTSADYQNEVSYFNPDFITEEDIEKVSKTIIEPAILNLSLENTEYVGIIGFDTILTRNGNFYLTGYKNFFDDLNIDFFLNGFDLNWTDIFESIIKGDIFLKYDFDLKTNYMLTLRQQEEIEFISVNSKINLERYIEKLELDDKEFYEAKKVWKY